MKHKNSVFLCGGGALGAWQSGVLYGLVKNGVEFNKIAGFSIGSINAAFYCFDMLDKAERLWSLISNEKVFRFSLSYSKPVKLFNPLDYSGLKRFLVNFENILAGFSLYSGKKVELLLKKYITKNLLFKDEIDFYCISHCVETSKTYIKIFNKGNYVREEFIRHLVASSAIPFIFPAVKINEDGKELNLVDGGVVGEGKIDLDFFNDSNTVFVISNVCDEDKNFKPRPFSLLDLFEYRVRRILLYQNMLIKRALNKINTKPKVLFITPTNSLEGRVIDFNGKRCLGMFKSGLRFVENNFKSLISN